MQVGSNINKEVQFAGVVPEIPKSLDPSSRTEVLRTIDQGQKDLLLAQASRPHVGAVLHVDVYNMKLFSKDSLEEPLLRIPIYQVAAVSYIKDDDLHIVSIKFGEVTKSIAVEDNLTCSLAALYCDARVTAEEICSFVELCFQTIYTDATMNFFDRSLHDNTQLSRKDISHSRLPINNSLLTNLTQLRSQHGSLGFLSCSSLSLGNTGSASSGAAFSHLTKQTSESELSSTAQELILDFMKELYTKLNDSELQEFASLVKAWHTNMTFPDFCQKVLDLYGSERRHLLVGMRPFIPARDSTYFERFLQLSGFAEDESEINSLIPDQSWAMIGPQRQPPGSFSSETDSFEMIYHSPMTDDMGSNNSLDEA